MSIEAYQIGVSFVADATKVSGPIGEMLRGMDRILERQKDVNMGFVSMVSSLGGARRLAGGLASDLERAAKAARDIASASGRFRPTSSGGTSSGSDRTSYARTSSRPSPAEMAAAATAATQQTNARGQLLLPAPDLRLAYDPSANMRTSTAGIPGNGILGGPGITVGAPYGPLPPSRPQRGLTLVSGSGSGGGGISNPPSNGFEMPFDPIPVGPVSIPRNTGLGKAATIAGNVTRAVGPYAAFAGIYGGAHGIHAMFRQGEDVGDTAAMMAHAYGPNGRLWSDEQIRRAQDLALNSVRTVPGASYAGTLEMAARASGITADANEALALTPTLARAGQIFAMRGAGPNAIQQVEAAIQSGEISGLNGKNGELDVNKLNTFIDKLSQTAFAMQGTFDLPKYLTGLRQYGVGASGSDMDFLTARLPSIMRVMQESRAGTALSSLDQLMLSPAPNTRNARYAKEQARIGLRDAKGNVTNRDELIRDPAQWYYDTLVPALSSHGFTDRGSVITELSNIFSRSTVQRLGASLSADTALYSREYQRNLAQQQQGNAPLMDYLKNAPGAQFASFTESWRAFEAVTSTAMMTPVVKSVQLMTGALQDITSYVQSHPGDVRQFGDDVHLLVSVMTGIAKGIGTVYSYIPAPLRHMIAGGVVGAGVGAVGASVVPGAGTAVGAAGGFVVGSGLAALSDEKQLAKDVVNNIHVYLDGKQIATHTQKITADQARKESRASNGMYDSWAGVALPGVNGGH